MKKTPAKSTIEVLGIWERLNNPAFNPMEFDGIKMQAGLNSFILTSKQWIERTGATGIYQMRTLTANAARLLEGGEQP